MTHVYPPDDKSWRQEEFIEQLANLRTEQAQWRRGMVAAYGAFGLGLVFLGLGLTFSSWFHWGTALCLVPSTVTGIARLIFWIVEGR